MKNNIFIKEETGIDQTSFAIVSEYDGKKIVIARCWDYLLAEVIRDTVEDYFKTNYKVVTELEII